MPNPWQELGSEGNLLQADYRVACPLDYPTTFIFMYSAICSVPLRSSLTRREQSLMRIKQQSQRMSDPPHRLGRARRDPHRHSFLSQVHEKPWVRVETFKVVGSVISRICSQSSPLRPHLPRVGKGTQRIAHVSPRTIPQALGKACRGCHGTCWVWCT